MYCKYCGAQIPENEKTCPQCGKKADKGDAFPWKTVLITLGAVALTAALAWTIWFAANGGFRPKANDIHYKDNYSVEADKVASSRDKVVATAEGESLTNARLQVFYWMHVIDFLNNNSAYLSYYGLDYTKPLNTQMYDKEKNLTWQQYFLEGALNTWKQYVALSNAAKKAGFTLPEDTQKNLDELEKTMSDLATENKMDSVEQLLQADMGAGCTLEDYRYYLELYYTANLFFAQQTESLEVSEEEINAYFAEHESDLKANSITKESGKLVDVRHILVEPEGGTKSEDGKTVTYSDEEWEACRKEAQALLDQWLAGDKTEDSFATLASEKTEDPGSKSNGGLYRYVAKGKMVKEFEDWCFDEARKPGDYGLVKTTYGYHIMYFVEGDEGWIRYCHDGVVSDKASELLKSFTENATLQTQYKQICIGLSELGKA